MDAHVFDDAEDGNIRPSEHLEALARVVSAIGRRGDDDGAGDPALSAPKTLGVARAGRHVDDQVIEIVPVGLV